MATAKRLPSGSYRVRVWVNDIKAYKSFTADTKRAAERMANEWLIDHEEEVRREHTLTFEKAARIYIEQRRATLSPTTIIMYEGVLKRNVERLKPLALDEITPQLVQDWVNGLAMEKSAKTVRNIYGFFTAVMSYHDVDIKLGKISLPKKTKKFKRLPTAELVLETFKGSEIELPVLLAVWGGLRISEILGMHKADIEGDVLTIKRVTVTMGSEVITKENAKTYNSNRQIRLSKPMLELISELEAAPDEPLIPFNRRQIYGRFKKAMEQKGYYVTFHDLRHVNASVMAALNVPDLYAMERGGWANSTTLRQVYQQTFTDDRQKIDRVIDNYFDKLYKKTYDTEYDTKRNNIRKTGT